MADQSQRRVAAQVKDANARINAGAATIKLCINQAILHGHLSVWVQPEDVFQNRGLVLSDLFESSRNAIEIGQSIRHQDIAVRDAQIFAIETVEVDV